MRFELFIAVRKIVSNHVAKKWEGGSLKPPEFRISPFYAYLYQYLQLVCNDRGGATNPNFDREFYGVVKALSSQIITTQLSNHDVRPPDSPMALLSNNDSNFP